MPSLPADPLCSLITFQLTPLPLLSQRLFLSLAAKTLIGAEGVGGTAEIDRYAFQSWAGHGGVQMPRQCHEGVLTLWGARRCVSL